MDETSVITVYYSPFIMATLTMNTFISVILIESIQFNLYQNETQLYKCSLYINDSELALVIDVSFLQYVHHSYNNMASVFTQLLLNLSSRKTINVGCKCFL